MVDGRNSRERDAACLEQVVLSTQMKQVKNPGKIVEKITDIDAPGTWNEVPMTLGGCSSQRLC
jgi:hypothetical protein